MSFQYAIRRNSQIEEQRDRELEDYLASLLPTAWVDVTFQNSWVNYDSTESSWAHAKYRKIGDITYIRGLVKDGTSPGTIFTLPAGFRPPVGLLFSVVGNNAFARLDVASSGAVSQVAGSNAFVDLNVQFSVTP